jgi:hypothetical protein
MGESKSFKKIIPVGSAKTSVSQKLKALKKC